jgi:hypothetical protein
VMFGDDEKDIDKKKNSGDMIIIIKEIVVR